MTAVANTIILRHTALRSFATQAFAAAGLSLPSARIAADILVDANLRGVDSHGIIRLAKYIDTLLDGGAKPEPNIHAVAEGPAYARMDGDNGLGLVVGAECMDKAIRLANVNGVGVVTAFNSSHYGAAAYYVMQATTQDMIGFALSNTTPVMTLWGGRGAALGNNPIAIGVPTNGMPLVLDMAVSKVAGGKVRLAAKQGKKIPADWVTDDEGTPTDDPQLFDQGIGALLPAGTKGYGLGIMVEVLAGVLAGARIMDEIPFYQRDTSKTVGLGHMFIAMKVDAFAPIEAFRERMDDLINRVHDAPKAKGVDSIYLPGELEHLCQQTREVSGIQVPEPVYADLMAVADRLELSKSMLESSDS